MGTVIIFLLVAILAIFGTLSALKNKNLLGIVFGLGTVAVFGFFAITTLIKSGYPTLIRKKQAHAKRQTIMVCPLFIFLLYKLGQFSGHQIQYLIELIPI